MDKGTLEAIRRNINDIQAQIATAEREREGKQIDVDKLCRALERTIREFFNTEHNIKRSQPKPPMIKKRKKKGGYKRRSFSSVEIDSQKEAVLNVLNNWTHYNGWMTYNELKRATGFADAVTSSRLVMLRDENKVERKEIYKWNDKYGDITQRTGVRSSKKVCIYRVKKYERRFF